VILAAAFLLRVGVHLGRTPGGVDTWYYLAYADAIRARPGRSARLPQYLVQDERQSSPPLFPVLLALLPSRWLRRRFWLVSPGLDCLHLTLLFGLAWQISGKPLVAAVAACVYAVTPQLVSETRSLLPRSLGMLLHSIAVMLAIHWIQGAAAWPWLALALFAGALLFLASATSSVGYLVAMSALGVVFGDLRYAAVASGAPLLAVMISGGHYLRVVRNYLQAVAFWRHNRGRLGAHPVRHSPLYGIPAVAVPARPGFLGQGPWHELLRMLGENPFVLALPLAPQAAPPWGPALHVWALALVLLAFVGTLLPPLRALGPGRGFLKAAAFPVACVLALGIGGLDGLRRAVGIASVFGLAASIAAIGFFYWYTTWRAPEQTASTPAGLVQAVARLAELPGGGVLCLPYGYSDYTSYHSGKPVLWGSHCGDHTRLQALAPVISQPLPELFARYGVRYLLIDTGFTTLAELRLQELMDPLGTWDDFALYGLRK
jgi:hypothetical protein